jgi:hypothetical protein
MEKAMKPTPDVAWVPGAVAIGSVAAAALVIKVVAGMF